MGAGHRATGRAGASPSFERHRVSGLYSVAHLFAKANRCGVYILEFTDRQRYVGQATDVARRFGSHRRVHAAIEYRQFCRSLPWRPRSAGAGHRTS